jgi:cholesterol transport system auxiliary component
MGSKIKFYIQLFFLMTLLMLEGCSLLSPVSSPSMKTYLLNDPVTQIASSAKSRKVLLVSEITSPAWLNTAQMAYQLENNQISYFALNQWAAPPADLLQPVVVHAISSAGLYRAVTVAPFSGDYDQRVDIQLLEMQQRFTPASSNYVMTLRVQLVEKSSQKILASRRFQLIVPSSQNNPQGGVAAANQAVKQWIPTLLNFIRAYR